MANFLAVVPFIQKAEGGMSRATSDTASKRPSPWLYKGQGGWHTNKGITFTTFKEMAPKLGYQVTADNFFTMPQKIWMPIYKVGYWDPLKLDKLNSQIMAHAIYDFGFNSGTGGAKRQMINWLKKDHNLTVNTTDEIIAAINKLTQSGDKSVFLNFIDFRKRFYKSLNQPKNEKGWFNRMDELAKLGLSTTSNAIKNAGTTVSENKTTTGGTLFFLILTAAAFYKRKNISAWLKKQTSKK
jgi:lysozyme family protein